MVRHSPKFFSILLFFIALTLLLLAAAWAYWPALTGPFLFDDEANLSGLAAFNNGFSVTALRDFLQTGISGPTGRPLSMLSFLLNDFAWPSQPGSFKYTNLLIHLLNGCLLLWLFVRLAARMAGGLNYQRQAVVLFLFAFWLLNPYHVSAVMYVVQRMALLAAMFVLAGLVMYMAGRERLMQGQRWQGYLMIWSAYLVGAGLGMLSKENAVLYVLMVPLLEWLCFARQGNRAPWLLKVTLAVPAVVLIWLLILKVPGNLENTHLFRDFTLVERLISQFRALGYYMWRYLIPGVSYTGVYVDGFEKSVGLLQPISTLLWMLWHIALVCVVLLYRQRWPMLALGILFYYVAHLLESSVIALELFFEHRNYLPSALLLLGLLHLPRLSRVGIASMLLVVMASLGLLRLQTSYWADEGVLNAVMMVENPKSERAVIAYAKYLQSEERHLDALNVLRNYSANYSAGLDVGMNLAVLACSLGRDSQEDVDSLLASPEKNRGKAAFFIGRTMKLASLKAEGRCQVLTLEDIDQLLENYMQAYSRDPMATQGYYVGKAYLQLVRGDYASFTREADEALAIWPNRELVLGLCWQIYELGKAADACGCFSAYEEIFDDAVNKKNHSYLRSAVGYNQALRNDFMLKKEQACSLEKSEEQ